jgi:hypothetical protein
VGGKFYVYEHWRPDTDVCFYVGKGKGRRSRQMTGRSPHHIRIQRKLARIGMCVEIRLVGHALSEDEALSLEIDRIAFWRSFGVALVNRTAGGEGSLNPCEETRTKMRNAKVGRRLSAEHKRKIAEGTKKALSDESVREKLKAVQRPPEFRDFLKTLHRYVPRTPEHYEKVSKALTGKKLSAEHAAKARVASLGRVQPRDEVEKRRAANVGKKRSEAFRALMSGLWTTERREAHRLDTIARNKARAELRRQAKSEAL